MFFFENLTFLLTTLLLIYEIRAQTTTRPTTTTSRPASLTTSRPITSAIFSTTVSSTVSSSTLPAGSLTSQAFNSSSNVIYWEKCGLEARTRITKIFQSPSSNNQHQIFYNPQTNSFIHRIVQSTTNSVLTERVIPLRFSLDGHVIFFLFDQIDKISIIFDCPNELSGGSSFSLELAASGISQTRTIELVQDAYLFPSSQDAFSTLGCKFRQTVQSGSLIYFPSVNLLQIPDNQPLSLISFYLNNTVYTFSLNKNGNIFLNGSDFVQLNKITLRSFSDVYFFFTNESVEIFDTCTVDRNKSIGNWSVTLFNEKLTIQTSLDYKIGNGATNLLLNSFCSVYRNASRNSLLDNSNRFFQSFLPSMSALQQIENVRSSLKIENFGLDQLIENEPRILIASRHYANQDFFNRGIQEYITGFSDGQYNLWIGLDLMNKLTESNNFKLRIEAQTKSKAILYEEYNYFKIANRSRQFRIEIDSSVYRDLYYFSLINGNTFSTFDYGQNRDIASIYAGGFWFSNNLNIFNTSCLTCSYNQSTTISLAGFDKIDVNLLRMYLIPSTNEYKFEYLSDSQIVQNPIDLLNLINFNESTTSSFKLLYRASRDGFSARSFYSMVKQRSKVLAIIKSGSNIFGGYTDLSWDGEPWGRYETDPNAFLFSFINPNKTAAVFRTSPYYYNSYYSIYDSKDQLMQFGSGADLRICENANTNYCSYSNLGNTYQISDQQSSTYYYGGYSYSYYFTGSFYFYVDEIELYQRLI